MLLFFIVTGILLILSVVFIVGVISHSEGYDQGFKAAIEECKKCALSNEINKNGILLPEADII